MAKTLLSRHQLGLVSSPTITNPTTTSETVVSSWSLPANFVRTGLGISANCSFLSGGTGTVTWRLRVGATGTISDTLVSTITTSIAQVANARGSAIFNIYCTNATTMNSTGFAIMQNALLGQLVGAIINATVVPSGVVFVSITAQVSVASANVITGAVLTSS